MFKLNFRNDEKIPLFKQIANAIVRDIEKGTLKKNFRLPSINEFHDEFKVGRDTVEKAYRKLKAEGYITSVKGKGNYVSGKHTRLLKILLIFNKLSSYKKIIYDNFLATLANKATVDLQIHHYNPKLLKEIIANNLGGYHYYVVMPHFFHGSKAKEYLDILKMIPQNELLILDKDVPGLEGNYMAVYQDFKQDIYKALNSAKELLDNYKRLTIVFPPDSNHPMEILDGAAVYCTESKKKFTVIDKSDNEELKKGTVYLVIADSDLAILIKKVRASGYQLGKEIGIISFNETVLKEVLDITVMTTDFEYMGITAANLILSGKVKKVSNPFKMIQRASL